MSFARVRAKWWFWRARHAVRQKQFESALSYFQLSLILLPESAHALCYVGYCLGALSRYEEALIFHDRALQLKPDYGSAHAQLGRMLMYLKRPQDAVESLTRAFRLQPNLREHVPYLSALAKGLGDLGRIEDALSAYREAATRDAKDVEMQAGIGWALWKGGNCKDAEGPLRNAIKLDPNYADSYDILGTVLRDLGRDEESIAVWQRLIELTPESADAHASLGWALGGVGRYREAILALQRASEVDPTFPTDYSIGLYHCYLKEYREAMEAEERVLSLGPDADAYCVLGASLGGLGDQQGAIRAARQALELKPEFPEAWYNLGNAYFETGRFEEAAASLQRVFELGRGIPDAHVLLGLTFLKLGRESAALEQCEFLKRLDTSKERELRDAIAAVMPQNE
jgi:tetratricopeptide (TPR) repeat protein